ncbi:MAG: hypothetical protein ACI8Q1_001515 [Parvicella sp.]|jgi:hypothetical protein
MKLQALLFGVISIGLITSCATYKEKSLEKKMVKEEETMRAQLCACFETSQRVTEERNDANGDEEKLIAIEEKYENDKDNCVKSSKEIDEYLKTKNEVEQEAFKSEFIAFCPQAKKLIDTENKEEKQLMDFPTIEMCQCFETMVAMEEETKLADGDVDKLEAVEAKYKEKKEKCTQLGNELEKQMKNYTNEQNAAMIEEFMLACPAAKAANDQ